MAFLVIMAGRKLFDRGPDYSGDKNPFEYDVSKYKKIDPALITYREAGIIELNLTEPAAVAVDAADQIYVTGDKLVLIFNRDGQPTAKFAVSTPAKCLAISSNGKIYLGLTDHVEIYDKTGKRLASWGKISEKTVITAIAVNASQVFVADAGSRLVRRFDLQGKELGVFGKKNDAEGIPGFIVPSPYFDLKLAEDETLWVVNPGRHKLENFSLDGSFRSSWGSASFQVEGFCGCCNPINIALLKDGSMVTSEKGLARIKIYNAIGKMTEVVAGPEQFKENTVIDLAVDSQQRILALDSKAKAIRIFVKKG